MANAYVLWGELRGDTSHFERSMRSAEDRLRRTETAMQKTGKATRDMVGALATAGTAYAALSVAKAAIDRTVEQARANRLLSASATEAGITYDQLALKNERFAKSVGLSKTAAAETTSNIARLATGAGLTGQMDQLLASFADLGAARGIQGEELNNLIGTILSGQDEGLNRLGISDPGKLYEAYAKSVGRSVESLTQQEKVQAAVNAVMEKASIFTGAAADRMNGFDGQIARTTANWNNFLDALSMTAVTSGPVVDFFNELSRATDNLSLSVDDVRKKLRAGMSPKEIAAEMHKGPSIGDRVSSILGYTPPAMVGYYANKAGLPTMVPDWVYQSMDPEFHRKRREEQTQAMIEAEKRAMEKQDAASYQTRVGDSQKTYLGLQKAALEADKKGQGENYAKERAQFLDQSERLVNSKLSAAYKIREAMLANHLSATQASEIQGIQQMTALKNQQLADELRNEQIFLNERLRIAKPDEVRGIQMQMAAASATANAEMTANSLQAQVQIREQMKRTKDEISSMFISSQSENPFLAIFDNGRLAIERVNEATKGLNPNLREMLTTLTQAGVATQAFGQRLENRLQSSNLRDEARQFLAGKLDKDTPKNFQKNLDRQLRDIGAFNQSGLTKEEKERMAAAVIALTPLSDLARMTSSQQSLAANARLINAAKVDNQEKDAKKIQAELVDVLKQLNGNKALQIDIRDPANRTTIGGTSQNVDARYPNR